MIKKYVSGETPYDMSGYTPLPAISATNDFSNLGNGWDTFRNQAGLPQTTGQYDTNLWNSFGTKSTPGSQGMFGDMKNWWGKTPWTGSGGKFSTAAKGVGALGDIAGLVLGIQGAGRQKELTNTMIAQAKENINATRAQAQFGLEKHNARQQSMYGGMSPLEAQKAARGLALEDMKRYGMSVA
jgi:hypothetical protein